MAASGPRTRANAARLSMPSRTTAGDRSRAAMADSVSVSLEQEPAADHRLGPRAAQLDRAPDAGQRRGILAQPGLRGGERRQGWEHGLDVADAARGLRRLRRQRQRFLVPAAPREQVGAEAPELAAEIGLRGRRDRSPKMTGSASAHRPVTRRNSPHAERIHRSKTPSGIVRPAYSTPSRSSASDSA